MRSHTGRTMKLVRGTSYSTSIRQKIYTKISTEAELAGVNDRVAQDLLTKIFCRHKNTTLKSIVHMKTINVPSYRRKRISRKFTRHIEMP